MLQIIDLEKEVDTNQYLQLVSDEIISMGYKPTTNNLIQILRLHQREAIRHKKGRFLNDYEMETLIIKELLTVLKKNVVKEPDKPETTNTLSDTIRIAIINQKMAESTCNSIKQTLQKYQ